MRLTLIALLLAGVVGCDATPEEPVSEFDVTLKAAEQGDARAQNMLGAMYHDGDGVPKDDVEAYAWLSLSVAQTNGDEDMKEELGKGLPELKAALTPEQLAAAEKRIEELTEQINANKAK